MLRAERARTRCTVHTAQIGLTHGASDGVDVRKNNVQGEEDKSLGREQENNEEERSHMSMDLTME